MNRKNRVNSYFIIIGCLLFLIDIVGLLFYINFMIRVLQRGVEKSIIIFQLLGFTLMFTILPAVACLFIGKGTGEVKHKLETSKN